MSLLCLNLKKLPLRPRSWAKPKRSMPPVASPAIRREKRPTYEIFTIEKDEHFEKLNSAKCFFDVEMSMLAGRKLYERTCLDQKDSASRFTKFIDDFQASKLLIAQKTNVKSFSNPEVSAGSKPPSPSVNEVSVRAKSAGPSVNGFTCVRGSIHQASPELGSIHSGTQCTSMCLAAIARHSAELEAAQWGVKDVDEIVRWGDQLHEKQLKRLGWPHAHPHQELYPEELNSTIESENSQMEVSVGEGTYILPEHFESCPDTTLENTIIRMGKSNIACLKGNLLFDPHARNLMGETDCDGTACLLNFDSVQDLRTHLSKKMRSAGGQIDLTPISVKRVGGQLIQ